MRQATRPRWLGRLSVCLSAPFSARSIGGSCRLDVALYAHAAFYPASARAVEPSLSDSVIAEEGAESAWIWHWICDDEDGIAKALMDRAQSDVRAATYHGGGDERL